MFKTSYIYERREYIVSRALLHNQCECVTVTDLDSPMTLDHHGCHLVVASGSSAEITIKFYQYLNYIESVSLFIDH
jgi:hypothetical protein